MSDFQSFAEHTVTKKREGEYERKRRLTLALYVLCPVLLFFVLLTLTGPDVFLWIIPILLVELLVVVPFDYNRRFKVAYDYRVASGELEICEIHNNRSRKVMITIDLGKAEQIAPYRDKYRDSADRVSYDAIYDASSSQGSEDLYFAVFPCGKDGKGRAILFFEPTQKMLSLISFYNHRTVVTKVNM